MPRWFGMRHLREQRAVGFSAVLLAWLTVRACRAQSLCPLPIGPCFTTTTLPMPFGSFLMQWFGSSDTASGESSGGLAFNASPFVLLVVTSLILPKGERCVFHVVIYTTNPTPQEKKSNSSFSSFSFLLLFLRFLTHLHTPFPASFVGHLAGIVVGFPLSWGWFNGYFLTSLAPWACGAAFWHCRDLLHPTRRLRPAMAAVLGSLHQTIGGGGLRGSRPTAAGTASAAATDLIPVNGAANHDAHRAHCARAVLALTVVIQFLGLLGGFIFADSLPPEAGWATLALVVISCAAVAHPPPGLRCCCGPFLSSPQRASLLPTLARPPSSSPSLASPSLATPHLELTSLSIWPSREDRQRLLLTATALSWFLAVSSWCNLAASAARWPLVAGGLAHWKGSGLRAAAEGSHAGIFDLFAITHFTSSLIRVSLVGAIWLPLAHLGIAAASAWVLTMVYPETAASLRTSGLLPSLCTSALLAPRTAPVAFTGSGVALGSSSGRSSGSSSGSRSSAATANTAASAWQLRGGAGRRGGGRGGRSWVSPGRGSGSNTFNGPKSAPLPNPWA